MNLVGKIFIVLIFLMSLVFMTISVAVYSSHTNWRQVVENTDQSKAPLGLKHQLTNAQEDVKALLDRIEVLKSDANTESQQLLERLSQLETANSKLSADRDAKDAALADAQKQVTAATNTMNRVAARLEDLKTELEQKRAAIRDITDENLKNKAEVVRLTDVEHQFALQLQRMQGIQMALAADKIRMEKLLEANNIPATSEPGATTIVDGLVSKPPTKEGYVEVTIGEDDGLRQGALLDVFHIGNGPTKYLGRLRVIKTEYDKSVGQIQDQLGPIQEGDRVFTKSQ